MKRVYIISRYRADSKNESILNANVARYFSKKVMTEGNIPVAPHIFFTQFLDDSNERERQLGLEAGRLELTRCDEFLLVLVDGVISEGMRQELIDVSRLKMKGHIVSLTKSDALELIKLGLTI